MKEVTANSNSIAMLDLSGEITELWEELNAAIQRVLRSGRFILGPEAEAFEREAADYLGVSHAVGVNSGTDALIIGLRALGVGPGDEVITTPFSFFATAESICLVGAQPVFVDIDERTFNIDPRLIEAAISERSRAIIPVHLFGLPAAMDDIMAIAGRHGLKVIEDCAQAFGASYHPKKSDLGKAGASSRSSNGKRIGGIGDVGAFSFYPTKNLGAYGDGGLLVTDDEEVAARARMLRNHGSKGRYRHEMLGYNSRLDELQAAILRVKLPYVDNWNRLRRRVAAHYNRQLAGVPQLQTPIISKGHIFHQYTLRLLIGSRGELQKHLKRNGIDTIPYYPSPIDAQPAIDARAVAPRSRLLADQVLSLPIWPSLPQEDSDYVTNTIRSWICSGE